MTLQWKYEAREVDWNALSALYREAPLGDKPPALLRTVFANSMFHCFIYDGDRLVGAGRVLADGADCAYLCDIAVAPSHQGRGLGGEIIAYLLERARGHRKIILYAAPGKEALYAKFGFRRMTTAMAIFEDQRARLASGFLREI